MIRSDRHSSEEQTAHGCVKCSPSFIFSVSTPFLSPFCWLFTTTARYAYPSTAPGFSDFFGEPQASTPLPRAFNLRIYGQAIQMASKIKCLVFNNKGRNSNTKLYNSVNICLRILEISFEFK
ncbi:hypothetical protein AVEN_133241-1 [Araneus ventricosus]|uniref:Uncharacterized protein n=1 Tax=Araneus ventricosus TaxID=182803 RepID=A0A4Y2XA24_ARAVE|nr:hypothetical protein AVEN_133241-1 [Araneus ventricosus]